MVAILTLQASSRSDSTVLSALTKRRFCVEIAQNIRTVNPGFCNSVEPCARAVWVLGVNAQACARTTARSGRG